MLVIFITSRDVHETLKSETQYKGDKLQVSIDVLMKFTTLLPKMKDYIAVYCIINATVCRRHLKCRSQDVLPQDRDVDLWNRSTLSITVDGHWTSGAACRHATPQLAAQSFHPVTHNGFSCCLFPVQLSIGG